MLDIVIPSLLPEKVILNHFRRNKEALAECGAHVTYVTNIELDLGSENASCITITDQTRFDIGRVSNIGIRASTMQVVVKSDIDIVFCADLIRFTAATIAGGRAYIAKCANIDAQHYNTRNWDTAVLRPAGRGAWFAMHKRDWQRLRGYDERLVGWGADDDNLYRRTKLSMNVVEHAKFELWHVNHKVRTGAYFPCTEGNIKIPLNWHTLPESADWGLQK